MSVLLSYIYSLSATDKLLLPLHHAKLDSIFIKFWSTISLTKKLQNVFGGRRGRDLAMQSVPITTDVVSSNFDQGEVYNILW